MKEGLGSKRNRSESEETDGWMDGYFVYRRSTLKGHIASNKLCYMMILLMDGWMDILFIDAQP